MELYRIQNTKYKLRGGSRKYGFVRVNCLTNCKYKIQIQNGLTKNTGVQGGSRECGCVHVNGLTEVNNWPATSEPARCCCLPEPGHWHNLKVCCCPRMAGAQLCSSELHSAVCGATAQ